MKTLIGEVLHIRKTPDPLILEFHVFKGILPPDPVYVLVTPEAETIKEKDVVHRELEDTGKKWRRSERSLSWLEPVYRIGKTLPMEEFY